LTAVAFQPAERKDFLDEASGIKEFQINRHQASLKLARTGENMEQAERLLQEVEPRLKLLRARLKNWKKTRSGDKLREEQEKYYATIYKNHEQEINEMSGHLSK